MSRLITIAALGAAFIAGNVTATAHHDAGGWLADQIIECDTDSDCEEKNPGLDDDVHADAPGGR